MKARAKRRKKAKTPTIKEQGDNLLDPTKVVTMSEKKDLALNVYTSLMASQNNKLPNSLDRKDNNP